MRGRLFIHATNVHQGGGRTLLEALLNGLPLGTAVTLCLDSRMTLRQSPGPGVEVRRVRPSVVERFLAERWLARNVVADDVVLCFGNLPPLFKLRGRAVVFVQNRYLVDSMMVDEFDFMTRARLWMERRWLSGSMANADEFVVQTPSMQRLLEQYTRGVVPVHVLPFVAQPAGYARSRLPRVRRVSRDEGFLYVASGEPHKNHRELIQAWCLLAGEGLFPSLRLTLDPGHSVTLCSWIESQVALFRLRVENVGVVAPEDIRGMYERADALIYPSTLESFGLPLIEARQAELPVVAAELDYVRDVLDPEQTFDPNSAVSIARAVKRFMARDEKVLPLMSAGVFLQRILQQTN